MVYSENKMGGFLANCQLPSSPIAALRYTMRKFQCQDTLSSLDIGITERTVMHYSNRKILLNKFALF